MSGGSAGQGPARTSRSLNTPGELLSESSYKELLSPGTVNLGRATDKCPATVCLTNSEATHYGMGVLVLGDWVAQHPLFFGYSASQAYLPSKRLAIAVSTTQGPKTPGRPRRPPARPADRRRTRPG